MLWGRGQCITQIVSIFMFTKTGPRPPARMTVWYHTHRVYVHTGSIPTQEMGRNNVRDRLLIREGVGVGAKER